MLESSELQKFFDEDDLAEAGRRAHAAYASADPFPHAVLDDFFPEALVESARRSAADPCIRWQSKDVDTSRKSWCSDECAMPWALQVLLFKLNSRPFLRFLEELSGIRGLIPDPYLEGGGLHRIERGGFLGIHADFNVLERLRLDRRLNLLLYLNEDWQSEWGGALELWDADMRTCVRRVVPSLGRMVVFSTTDVSFHGHPHPLACPPERARISIALYYYTAGRPERERSEPHSTLYKTLPEARADASSARAPTRLGRLAARLSNLAKAEDVANAREGGKPWRS